MNKWDNFWLGVLIGLLLPSLFCIAYSYTIHLRELWQPDMIEILKPVIGRMLLLSVFANMAAMFILYEFNLWRLAKGVFIAILPYMAAGIVLV